MDTGTAAHAAGPSASLSSGTNRRRKWFRRFWRRSPPPAYPRHVTPRRKCIVRKLFRRFVKKRRHISTDTAISAFYSSRIREIDGPGLIFPQEEYEPVSSAPITGPSRDEQPTVMHSRTSQSHASRPTDALPHTSRPVRRDKSLPPTPRATRASANTHITFSVDSLPPSQRYGPQLRVDRTLAEMNQRVTWRDSDQQASGGPHASLSGPQASSSALQPTPGPSRTEAALPAPSTSARQRPSSAPSPRHLAPRAQPTNAHSRHTSMPVPQRPSSAQRPRSATPPPANPPDAPPRPSSASPRPSSASPQVSPQHSLRRSSGRILQKRTSQTPAVVREGSSHGPPLAPRSQRNSPPPNTSGPSRGHNDAYQRNDALHVSHVQPGPSTSTVNRSDPTAMFSTPPPGSTGQTTPDPQNASAPRLVSAHQNMARAREDLEALREHVEEHGRAHEPRSSVRARARSRRSHATTHVTRFVPGSATSAPGHHEEVGDEGEEVVEEGDGEGADDEWTDEDETPRVPAMTFGAAQAQAMRRMAESARPQAPLPQPSPPQPARQVEEPVLQRPQPPGPGAMEIVESPRSSIAMTFYPRSPLLDTPLTPPEFKLSEVPAGTQDVLREAEHRARALGGGETLQVIATQVHATRRMLTKYRHITVVVDTEAKRRHTTAWTDGVQLMKSTCEEILQKLRDPANARDDEWLSRRRQRLARYLTQLLKATKDIIADKRREYEVLIRMYNERKNFVFANIRAMEVDYDALREMRHWCGVEAARRYVRQDYY